MVTMGGGSNDFFQQKVEGTKAFEAKETAVKNLDVGKGTLHSALAKVSKDESTGTHSVVYLTKHGWQALDKATADQKRQAGDVLIAFSKKDIKTLLKTDNVVTRELIKTSNYVATLEEALKLQTENPFQRLKIALGFKSKTDGIAERHWKQFGLENLYADLQPEKGYQGDLEQLKKASASHIEIQRYREPVQAAVKSQTSKLEFAAPFSTKKEPQLVSAESVPDGHPALTDPNAKPYSHSNPSNNGGSNTIERCKGYIDPDEHEVSGDFCGTAHYDTHSIAYVIDSAGNQAKDYSGAKAAAQEIHAGVNEIIKEHGNDPDAMKKALGDLLEKVHFNQLLRGKEGTGNKVTLALNIRINCEDGRQLLLGVTVGDARILYVNADGKVENMTKSSFFKPYPDSGGSLGDTKLDSKAGGGNAIQMFARYMNPGDEVVGFSDGAEILEPKSNTQSPKAAYDELVQAGKAPKLSRDPNNLPSQVVDWTDPKWERIGDGHPEYALKQDLQAIHDASTELHAGQVMTQDENRAKALFDHVTTADITDLGKQVQLLDKQRKSIGEQTNAVLDEIFRSDTEYSKKNDEIRSSQRDAVRANVVAARRQSGAVQEFFRSIFSPKKREASINQEVENEINRAQKPENIALREVATQQMLDLKEKIRAKPEHAARILESQEKVRSQLGEFDEQRVGLVKKIAQKIAMPEAELEALLEKRATYLREWHDKKPDERPKEFRDDPLDVFFANNVGKPDDLAVFSLAARPGQPRVDATFEDILAEQGRKIRQKPLPTPPQDI